MAKELADLKSKPTISNPVIEGADMATTTSSGSGNGELIMDERVPLTLEQAVSLRNLFQAKKERIDGVQNIDASIELAYQMLGIQGREIIAGELGDDNPHLMLKAAETNGAIQ